MNLLLDTHTFIWFLNGDKKLSERAKLTIENSENKNFISTVSIWEVAIKSSLGKLKLKGTLDDIRNQFLHNGFELLPITFDHTIILQQLDFFHRDPFDRMIISQAITDNLTIITKNQNFQKYDIKIIW